MIFKFFKAKEKVHLEERNVLLYEENKYRKGKENEEAARILAEDRALLGVL